MTTPTHQDDALAARLAEAALGEDITHDGVTYRKVRWAREGRNRDWCAESACPLLGPGASERDACDRYRYERSISRRFPCDFDLAPDYSHTIANVDRIPLLAVKGLLA